MSPTSAYHMAMQTMSRINEILSFKKFFGKYTTQEDDTDANAMIGINEKMLFRYIKVIKTDLVGDAERSLGVIANSAYTEELSEKYRKLFKEIS